MLLALFVGGFPPCALLVFVADGPWGVQDLVAKRGGFGPAGRFFIGALEEGCEGLVVSGDGRGIAVMVMIGDEMSSGSSVGEYSIKIILTYPF